MIKIQLATGLVAAAGLFLLHSPAYSANDVWSADDAKPVYFNMDDADSPSDVTEVAPLVKEDCRPCRERYFIAGVEATFLRPELDGNPLTFRVEDLAAPPAYNLYSTGETQLDSLEVGPRVWVGIQGECWGAVVRYWGLSDSAVASDGFGIPGDLSGFVAENNLDIYTVDLEITRRFCLWQTDGILSFGARYAEYSNEQSISASEIINGDIVTATAMSAQDFCGTGITFGIAGVRPIGCRSFSLFWNVRGSVIWDDLRNEAATSAAIFTPLGSGYGADYALGITDDDLFIGEAQLGVQWNHELACVPAKAFFRAALEYQYWEASESSAAAFTTAFDVGVAQGTSVASSGALRTDLIGFTLGAGFYW